MICETIELDLNKFYEWRKVYGKARKEYSNLPKFQFITEDEKLSVINFYQNHTQDGYRRCAYMMIDQDIAYLAPSTVYKILKFFGVIRSKHNKPSKKGNGFEHAKIPHEQWHTDISHVLIKDKYYHLISILDGFSRYVVHWELRKEMSSIDVCIVQQRAIEKFPNAKPRMISDNGKQFLAKDYQALLSLHGLKHTRTSPYYPQSNGKQERFHKTIKGHEGIGNKHLTDFEHAVDVMGMSIDYYNNKRLHSAIGYVTPNDMLNLKQRQIHQQRDAKIATARLARRNYNKQISVEILPAGEASRRETTEAQELFRIRAEGRALRVMPKQDLNEGVSSFFLING